MRLRWATLSEMQQRKWGHSWGVGSYVSRLERICENHNRMESARAVIAANEAKIAANEAEIAAKKDRERVLWLRGIL
jgi:ABC-type hemin transport system substrate-binding protein